MIAAIAIALLLLTGCKPAPPPPEYQVVYPYMTKACRVPIWGIPHGAHCEDGKTVLNGKVIYQ